MPDTPVGTDDPDYPLTSADLGATIYCKVTATNASGTANADSNTVGPVAAEVGFETETTAWAAAVTAAGGTVLGPRKTVVNTLIAGLKTDGVWALLDRIWLFAGHDTQAALRDLKTIDVAAPSGTGSPTFTVDRGYVADPFNNVIDTTFVPSTNGVNFQFDSASVFAYNRGTGAMVGTLFGAHRLTGGTKSTLLAPRQALNVTQISINAGGPSSFTNTPDTTTGFWVGSRTDDTTLACYRGGTLVSTDTGAANAGSGLPDIPVFVGGTNNDASYIDLGTDDQIACVGFGAGLNATQAGNLYTRIQTYMTSVGANV